MLHHWWILCKQACTLDSSIGRYMCNMHGISKRVLIIENMLQQTWSSYPQICWLFKIIKPTLNLQTDSISAELFM